MISDVRRKILVITPVKHIAGVSNILEDIGEVTYLDDPSLTEVISRIGAYQALFTNPNKSKVFIGKEVIDAGENLEVICTASTGTNHIDMRYAHQCKLPILSLTEEREVISNISSTAELAFALTLAVVRKLVPCHNDSLAGSWDYTRYIGRQMDHLTVGVIGYGRLGRMYSNYCSAFKSRVLVFDPFVHQAEDSHILVDNIEYLLSESDIISIHVHVNEQTYKMINEPALSKMKSDVVLINTSRGDIVDEAALVDFLKRNPNSKVGTDVLADEIRNRDASLLLDYAKNSKQVLITQHIGGMTSDAQELAYRHAAQSLSKFFS